MALEWVGRDGVLLWAGTACSSSAPSTPLSSSTARVTLHARMLPCPATGEVEYIGFRFEPRIKVLEEVRREELKVFNYVEPLCSPACIWLAGIKVLEEEARPCSFM